MLTRIAKRHCVMSLLAPTFLVIALMVVPAWLTSADGTNDYSSG
jgi:hypothetical protein